MEEQQVEVQDVKQDTTSTASEEKQSVNQVPYARFSELVDEKNTLKVELDSLKKEAKQQAENRKLKEMESKGEYDKIMADMTSKLEAAENKADAFDELNATERESLLSELPEEDRATYEGLSLINLRVHVNKFNSKPNPANVDNSKPTKMGGYSSDLEYAIQDPEGYEKAKKGTGTLSKFGNIFNPSGNS
jgi:alanyl-tRNA synthetase